MTTPQTIAERAAQIRAGWDEDTEIKRATGYVPPRNWSHTPRAPRVAPIMRLIESAPVRPGDYVRYELTHEEI